MAITSEIIGKLGGGAEVQKIPVNIVADGGGGSVVVMHTVHVQEGETWLVVLSGDLDPRYSSSSGPVLSIGEVRFGPGLPAGRFVAAEEVMGTTEIALKRNNSNATDSFTGHVYAVKL